MPHPLLALLTMFLAAAMELGALLPLALMAAGMIGAEALPAWQPAVALGLAALLSRKLALGVEHRRVARPTAARLLGGGGVGVAIIGAALMPAHPFLALVVVGAAWWRGMAVAAYGGDHRRLAETAMRLGALLVAPVALQMLANLPGWSAGAAPYYLLFAAAGLAAMAAARLQALWPQDQGQGAGGARTGVAAALAGMALVLVPALLVWALAVNRGAFLVAIVNFLGRLVLTLVSWIIMAFVWTVGRLIFAVWQVVARLLKGADPPTAAPAPAELFPREWLVERALNIPPAWIQALGIAAFALALLLVGLVLFRSFSRLFQPDPAIDVPEERESIFSWRKLRRSRGNVAAKRAADADLGTDAFSQVRRLYRLLQDAGARAGRPRRPAETPDEYVPELLRADLPATPVLAVTRLYRSSRYGDQPPDLDALTAAELAAGELAPPPARVDLLGWWRRRRQKAKPSPESRSS